jgi:hypothetical protein
VPFRTSAGAHHRVERRVRWTIPKGVEEYSRREAEFSSGLTNAEKERLHDLLRHLMLAFPDWKHKKHAAQEAETGEPPSH